MNPREAVKLEKRAMNLYTKMGNRNIISLHMKCNNQKAIDKYNQRGKQMQKEFDKIVLELETYFKNRDTNITGQ